MPDEPQDKFTERERRLREEANPVLDREHRTITIGPLKRVPFKSYLEQNQVQNTVMDDGALLILDLSQFAIEAEFDRIQRLIDDWKNGADFTPNPD